MPGLRRGKESEKRHVELKNRQQEQQQWQRAAQKVSVVSEGANQQIWW